MTRHPLALLAEVERILPRVIPGPYHHDARATDYITTRSSGVEHAVAVVLTSSTPETGDLLALSWEMAQALRSLAAENAALRAQAEAEAGVWLICWEPGDPYESGGIEDGAWRTEAEAEIERARLEAEERASWAAYPGYSVKTYMLEFRPFALAQAGGES